MKNNQQKVQRIFKKLMPKRKKTAGKTAKPKEPKRSEEENDKPPLEVVKPEVVKDEDIPSTKAIAEVKEFAKTSCEPKGCACCL